MRCPKCYKNIGKLKKHRLYNCSCGAKLLAVEINKELEVFDLSKNTEEEE